MTIIQEEETGCGIASVANIIERPYSEVKAKANSMDIFAEDKALYSGTEYVRRLLREYGIQVSNEEVPFESWDSLPDVALLSIKYREENGCSFWPWVVFKRTVEGPVVLDSAAYLEKNERNDFYSMQPKWFIKVSKI
ncbi:MAG: hypothetical protein IME96_10615 [Proteobacteria bacterium]|nr:hypothetical protein [Pseudomonadota bacterium]